MSIKINLQRVLRYVCQISMKCIYLYRHSFESKRSLNILRAHCSRLELRICIREPWLSVTIATKHTTRIAARGNEMQPGVNCFPAVNGDDLDTL